MALRVYVCRTGDVADGEARAFEVDGVAHPVLIVNSAGTYRACSSICPHEDVSLDGGDLEGTRLTCPGHGYEFDLVTGRCDPDASLVLPRYRVTLIGDAVWIDMV